MDHSLEQLHDLHEMCAEELRDLLTNARKYIERSTELANTITAHWENIKKKGGMSLIGIEIFQENLIQVLNISRKFNLQLETNGLERCSTSAIFNIFQDPPCSQNQTENNKSGKCENWAVRQSIMTADEHINTVSRDDELNKLNLYYPKKELTQYHPGSVINATITYVKDNANLQFYVWDLSDSDLSHAFKISNAIDLRQYVNLPPKNEVFGLVLDSTIVRAVLEDTIEIDVLEGSTKNSGKAYLLDFGEIINVSTKDIMYHLPQKEQQIEAQAILCQLNNPTQASTHRIISLQNRLDKLLHKKVKFIVKSVNKNIVNVLFAEDEFENSNDIKRIPEKTNTNPFLEETFESKANDSYSRSLKINSVFGDGLTEEELDILFDDSPGTTNAMKAVMGYNPKDEKRICPFYDPKIEWCFKGSRCQLEHTPLQPDGWTKDALVCDAIIECPIPELRYESGTMLKIIPTFIEHLDHFYAQIVQKDNDISPLIWSDKEVANFKVLKKMPLQFDLVLARYEDSLWYRARVIETDEISHLVKVFYVDYGNVEHVQLKNLKQCEPSVAKLPYQAILCRIANLGAESTTPELYLQGLNLLCNSILNKNINVEVVSHYEDLIIRFIEKDLINLPKTLIQLGCGKTLQTIVI